MSTRYPYSDKSTADERGVALIDETTITRLHDEKTAEHGCRFAAVARSLEHARVPNTHFSLPKTVVAYVDQSGRYGIEREFFGHRPDWTEIPRTVVVTEPDVVREIPDAHRDRYREVLGIYGRVLGENDET
ncbi:hypothetical protein [Natronococcus wangiae]|uniref:hypothetical protein n=1 Tax=Natronococcus wangiae TaxID=3068275 RepID=UPI00273E5084|nr:hypothetical protein [Natronococcus sp. AD5]